MGTNTRHRSAMTVMCAAGGPPPGEDKIVLNVEVCLRLDSGADLGAVRTAALAFLTSLSSVRYAEGPLAPPAGQHPLLDAHVASLLVTDLSDGVPPGKLLLQWDVSWNVSSAVSDRLPCGDGSSCQWPLVSGQQLHALPAALSAC